MRVFWQWAAMTVLALGCNMAAAQTPGSGSVGFSTTAVTISASSAATQIATTDVSNPTPAILAVLLAELDMLLARNDTATINLLDEHGAALRDMLGPAFETVSHYVNLFDFEAARLAMKQR